MDTLCFILYTLFVLTIYVIGFFIMWFIENWELISLAITNIIALFMNPPKRKK